MRDRKSLHAGLAILGAAAILHACGGGDDSMPSGSAVVSAYVTDDLGGYESVVLTLNSVQLRHSGGRSCEIIRGPLVIDAADLGRDQLVELVNTANCEVGPYNRLHVEIDDDVTLRQTSASPPQACKFVSYYDDNSGRPNRLACANGSCSLDITGAVNLIADRHEHLALDADLKQFTVIDGPPCEVTLKVSPMNASEKLAAGYRMSLSGTVSSLDSAADRFVLTVAGRAHAVQYAGVTDQIGLDALLERASTDGLRTAVRCQSMDSAATPPICTAQTDTAHPRKAISVKAKGTVSGLDTVAHTFTLGYGAAKTLPVDYTQAFSDSKVEGALDNDKVAEVKLFGFNTPNFLAREVEAE